MLQEGDPRRRVAREELRAMLAAGPDADAVVDSFADHAEAWGDLTITELIRGWELVTAARRIPPSHELVTLEQRARLVVRDGLRERSRRPVWQVADFCVWVDEHGALTEWAAIERGELRGGETQRWDAIPPTGFWSLVRTPNGPNRRASTMIVPPGDRVRVESAGRGLGERLSTGVVVGPPPALDGRGEAERLAGYLARIIGPYVARVGGA